MNRCIYKTNDYMYWEELTNKFIRCNEEQIHVDVAIYILQVSYEQQFSIIFLWIVLQVLQICVKKQEGLKKVV